MPLFAESKRSAALRAKRATSPTIQRTKEARRATLNSHQVSCVFCKTPFASKSKAPLVATATTYQDTTMTPNKISALALLPPASPLTRAAKETQQTFFGLSGKADRVQSMHFTPFARIVRCGHLVCYPCAVAHGATTGRNDCEGLQPSIAMCPCCLRESSVDLCRKVQVEDVANAANDKMRFRRETEISHIEQQSADYPTPSVRIATIEELRARYIALRAQQAEKALEFPLPHCPTIEAPVSILKKDGYRTPEAKGRCVFNESPLRTPSTEPMGVTPMTNSPAMTVAHSPCLAESPTPVCILDSTDNELHLPTVKECSFATPILRRHSFVGGGGSSRASLSISDSRGGIKTRTSICPSPFDLIFLSNLQPKTLPTLVNQETHEMDDRNRSPMDDDDRSTLIATSSSPLTALISPRREMSRDSVKIRRLARMQLWMGELQGDGPSPSLCTSARSHRSMTSARSERSMDLPLSLMRSVSEGRCAIEGCEDMAVPVVVEGIEEMNCEVPFPFS